MEMQNQEEEKEKVDELVDLGVENYLGAEEVADAVKASRFPVEGQPEAQRLGFGYSFYQDGPETICVDFVNWRVLREELETRIARKREANPAR